MYYENRFYLQNIQKVRNDTFQIFGRKLAMLKKNVIKKKQSPWVQQIYFSIYRGPRQYDIWDMEKLC